MVYETTYTHDENNNVVYFETVDDAEDIAAAFMNGDTVIIHFPRNEEAVETYRFFETYMRLINYQPAQSPSYPESFIFCDSTINNCDPIYCSINAMLGTEVVDGKLRVHVNPTPAEEEILAE